MFDAKAWLLSAMLILQPPTKVKCPVESVMERVDRYEAIAQDIIKAAEQEGEPVDNNDGRMTAAVVLGITFHESGGWAYDVDFGTHPLRRGEVTGQWCLGQINVGQGKTKRGWTGPELVRDRIKCLRETIDRARLSLGACSKRPLLERLAVYASGSCDYGRQESRIRMRTALRVLAVPVF